MKAALIITGSEIITGKRQDAIVQPFAVKLLAKGIPVAEVRMLGDSPADLSETVANIKADLVIVTGGLGETPDDTTRKAVAAIPGVQDMNPIDNPVGSAKGIDLKFPDKRVVFFPGVPREAYAMIDVILSGMPDATLPTVNIPVFGMREQEIAKQIGMLAERCGYLPKDMEITVVAPVELEKQIRDILGMHALEEADLSTTVGRLLESKRLRFAAAESCTGGLIGHLITYVPGSSKYFLGSVTAYSNDVKTGVLGVPADMLAEYGAVSEQVADAMLTGILKLTCAEIGVATTGIAGPDGGTADKPVGTVWIAAGTMDERVTRKFNFWFDRPGNKLISAKVALYMLRSFIYDKGLHSSAFA
jgi:nicotinamide-nucleotide amidase